MVTGVCIPATVGQTPAPAGLPFASFFQVAGHPGLVRSDTSESLRHKRPRGVELAPRGPEATRVKKECRPCAMPQDTGSTQREGQPWEREQVWERRGGSPPDSRTDRRKTRGQEASLWSPQGRGNGGRAALQLPDLPGSPGSGSAGAPQGFLPLPRAARPHPSEGS